MAIGACLRRIALRAYLALHRGVIEEAVGKRQYAIGRPGGADALYKELVRKVEETHGAGVLSLDVANAFGAVNREAVQKAVRARAPDFAALTDRLLTATTINHYDLESGQSVEVEQRTGVPQGCPMSGVLFAIALGKVVERAGSAMEEQLSGTEVLAYADDMYSVGPAQNLQASLALLQGELQELGLSIKDSKTKVWVSDFSVR